MGSSSPPSEFLLTVENALKVSSERLAGLVDVLVYVDGQRVGHAPAHEQFLVELTAGDHVVCVKVARVSATPWIRTKYFSSPDVTVTASPGATGLLRTEDPPPGLHAGVTAALHPERFLVLRPIL